MARGLLDYNEIRPYFDSIVGQLMELPELAGDKGVIIGVTSANYKEGVSTVTSTLAFALSENGTDKLLLLDANLWDPRQHIMFRVAASPGLADLLLGGEDRDYFLATKTDPPFKLMPAGVFPRDIPRGVFLSKKIPKLINSLRKEFSFVLVDLPPLAASNSVVNFCGLLDGVIMVVEAESTRWEVAESAKETLAESGVNLMGAIFNKRRFHIPDWLYGRL